jgi:two-component system phosphate regulon sensor histidine kinase PhoR
MPAVALLGGAVLGGALGWALDMFLSGVSLGALSGLAVYAASEWQHARRFGLWLREGAAKAPITPPGLWGEMTHRVTRLLRDRDVRIAHAERQLQQFFDAIEASPNGVMLLDADEGIAWCNTVAAQHFGLDPTRDLAQRVTHLVRYPPFVGYLQASRFDQPLIFSASPVLRLSLLVRPYGEGMKLVLSQDVTERERAEAMRRDFVANVSHEIRTPLTVVSGFLETLTELPLSETERNRAFLLMQQQTQRMQSLVGDLLTLAQLEGSPNPGADRWLPAGALLRRSLADAKALSSGRHSFESDIDDGAELACSESELLSAVSNLLNNAVRYTPEGGCIWLRWHWRPDGGADIEVEDNGPGIAREHLPRLTERFYRVDGSRSRDTGGTGLGLSIVKHVAQRHGGEIEVRSEVGKGSSFRVVLPAYRVRARQLAASGTSLDAALARS